MTPYEKKEASRVKRLNDQADRAAKRARDKVLAQLKTTTLTPPLYKAALKKLDISISGAGVFFGVSPRQAQRIAAEGPVPKLFTKVIKLLLDGKLKKEDLL